MNALPVACQHIGTKNARASILKDMRRWRFDIACVTFGPGGVSALEPGLLAAAASFASELKAHGCACCGIVPLTAVPEDLFPVTEYQRDERGSVIRANGLALASPASAALHEHVLEQAFMLGEKLGFDWLLLADPLYGSDIPYPADPIWQRLLEAHPDLQAPETSADTPEYRKIQQIRDAVVQSLVRDAIGAGRIGRIQMAGVRPSPWAPVAAHDSLASLRQSPSPGLFARMPEVDFLGASLSPETIAGGAVHSRDELHESPLLMYPETIAHQTGKPVLVMGAGLGNRVCEPVPEEFRRRYWLSALAACPAGLTGPDYEPGAEEEAIGAMLPLLRICNRLGQPFAQIVYVVSESASRHSAPYRHSAIWRRWWAFGREMLLEKRAPALLIHAESLDRQLEENPHLRLLVLSSAFPITRSQMESVQGWLQADDGRGLVVFAESPQLSADADKAGHVSLEDALPGLYRMLGLPWPQALEDARGNMLLAIDPEKAEEFARNLGISSDAATIQKLRELQTEGQQPDRTTQTLAMLPMGPVDMPVQICRFVRGMATHCGASPPPIHEADLSVLWSRTKCGYLILTNPSVRTAEVRLRLGQAQTWDVRTRRFCAGRGRIKISGLGYRLLRLIEPDDPLLDVDGQMMLYSIQRQKNSTLLDLWGTREITLRSTVPPKSVRIGRKELTCSTTEREACRETRVTLPAPGRTALKITWP